MFGLKECLLCFFLPIPGKRSQCRLIKMTLVNPMGSIPHWVISLMKKKSAQGVPLLISTVSELVSQTKIKEPSVDQGYISDTESDEYFDADTYFEDMDDSIVVKPKSILSEDLEEHQSLKLLLKQLEENSKLLDTSLKQLETILVPNTNLSTTSYIVLFSWPIVGIAVYHFLWNRK